jgi:RNA polymerase sigma-70 factor (ECF subfamily)
MKQNFMNDFHDLFTRNAGDIYRFALFLCGNKAEAEDITAETFARVITGKAPLVTATVKGYLLTIARNLHLESLRRKNGLQNLHQRFRIRPHIWNMRSATKQN